MNWLLLVPGNSCAWWKARFNKIIGKNLRREGV
jgi:hypothetical protein